MSWHGVRHGHAAQHDRRAACQSRMPRNAEGIRHWQMLLAVDAARTGVTVKDLAARFNVTTRTVCRHLVALRQVGFPPARAGSRVHEPKASRPSQHRGD